MGASAAARSRRRYATAVARSWCGSGLGTAVLGRLTGLGTAPWFRAARRLDTADGFSATSWFGTANWFDAADGFSATPWFDATGRLDAAVRTAHSPTRHIANLSRSDAQPGVSIDAPLPWTCPASGPNTSRWRGSLVRVEGLVQLDRAAAPWQRLDCA